ncbi:MAG: glycosyltransferase [Mariprofundus sp.]|nr:glycosyltransferase [Mariprofundus sp.]
MLKKTRNVLHVANWYPNQWHEHEGVFVKEQCDLFSNVVDVRLVNVQVRSGSRWFEFKKKQYSETETGYYLLTRISKGKIIELLTTLLLLWVLKKEKANQYDLLHVHIAYPLLIHYRWWKRWIKTKVLISEHWTAYHFNFYLPENSPKLKAFKRIFQQQIPLIAVSNALLQDIREFSGGAEFPGHVLPNVIDLAEFRYSEKKHLSGVPTFFTVNLWRDIKNPFPMLEGFLDLARSGERFKLIIGGYGPLLEKMQQFVSENKGCEAIKFTGAMNKTEIAEALWDSDAYVFSSSYETFSVACAQALCCGVPLMGPSIPAIREYAGRKDMIIVPGNSAEGWENTIRQFLNEKPQFDRQAISCRAVARFATAPIQQRYGEILDACLSELTS